MVQAVFPSETVSQVRSCIRQKLNNADKLCKRKVAVQQVPGSDSQSTDYADM